MKSRIRSRWHRPNEKPLENDALPAPVSPMGEIDSSNPSVLTDDLSHYKPDEKVGHRQRNSEHANDRRNGRRNDHRRSKSRNNNRRDHSSREKQTAVEGDAKKSSSHPKRKPRKRNNNHHKKGSDSTLKNTGTRSSNSSKPANKPTQQATGLKGFLGKLFG